ncbi:hypothetical protein [Dielma fastidiosa]|jgi:hypothetical protein|uniref:glycine-rich domain-containing protein n=1 Tax=Dielma fastidiosa TaxID=1034346 RepID=UPI0023F2389F|nr:hypothetical protein [Dielma fastidiosa]
MSWGEVKYAINSTLGTEEFTSLDQVLINSFGGHELFTESGTFTVPAGISEIYISACAAGGSGGNGSGGVAGKAGQFIIRERVRTLPGEKFNFTIGDGNTVITSDKYSKTLIANSVSGCAPNDVLGYWTGYSALDSYYTNSDGEISVNSTSGKGGNGGAFGYGGAGGNYCYDLSGYKNYPSLGGSSVSLIQSNYPDTSLLRKASLMCGGDSINSRSSSGGSNGEAAGGYGAGGGGAGGSSRIGGKGSPGMVFIEWGGLRR